MKRTIWITGTLLIIGIAAIVVYFSFFHGKGKNMTEGTFVKRIEIEKEDRNEAKMEEIFEAKMEEIFKTETKEVFKAEMKEVFL